MPFVRSPEQSFSHSPTRPYAARYGYLFITIMLFAVQSMHLAGQQMTTQAPPPVTAPGTLPDDPAHVAYPTAHVVVAPQPPEEVSIDSKGPQSYQRGVYVLDQEVVITYKDRRVAADHMEYDSNTGELTVTGHVLITAAANQERMTASHGVYNLRTATGRFYDVDGSVGIASTPSARRTIYTTDNPFLFTGRVVVKTGAETYDVYDGTVTSCRLPKPDWIFSAAHISLANNVARAHNSVFRLFNFPLLFLPYVTHPAKADVRESGLLIPTIGQSSTKGTVIGEQFYVAINRSIDLTVGANYYSSIGWAQMATLRYKGPAYDFLKLHYAGVIDRRTGTANQGGEEVVLSGRHDFSTETRAAVDLDYLSSYIYREAFSDNFNQAVTSDIVSDAYITHTVAGLELAAFASRYQGIKVVGTPSRAQQEIHIFHLPTLSLSTTDHMVPRTGNRFSTGLEVSLESSASGLKRTQPNFETGGVIERFDLHPQASYPISLAQWHIVPSAAARETIYSRSRATDVAAGQPPTQSKAFIARSDFEFALDIRPPVLTRTFQPKHLQKFLGTELRHTVEPELNYKLTNGVNNFTRYLRFDANDVVSNVDLAEYGVTQRIFRRRPANADASSSGVCGTEQVAQAPGFSSEAPNDEDDMPEPAENIARPDIRNETRCPSEELISWRLTQQYFFDQTFGAAVVNGRRNIFTDTLALSGVAFLTEPRAISPLISRLRVRSSAHTDLEWDFDLDTSTLKFNSSNVFIDLHHGNTFGAFSYSRLDAPGRFYTENPTPTAGVAATDGVTSAVSDFNQLRLLAGYGSTIKRGFSIAANTGIDLKALYGATQTRTVNSGGKTTTTSVTVYPALLQYGTIQASYNWNCCGLAMEYRKLELGSVRNEGTYRFNFTLANIASVGNLRRAERLF